MADSITDSDLERLRRDRNLDLSEVRNASDLKTALEGMTGTKNSKAKDNLIPHYKELLDRPMVIEALEENVGGRLIENIEEASNAKDIRVAEREAQQSAASLEFEDEVTTARAALVNDSLSEINSHILEKKITPDTKIRSDTVDVIISVQTGLTVKESKEFRHLATVP